MWQISFDNSISSPYLATGIFYHPTGESAPDPPSWIGSSDAIFNSFCRFFVWLKFVLCFGHSNTQIYCLIHSVASAVCRGPVFCCNKNLCLSVKPLVEWNRLWPRIFLYRAPIFITSFPVSSIEKPSAWHNVSLWSVLRVMRCLDALEKLSFLMAIKFCVIWAEHFPSYIRKSIPF